MKPCKAYLINSKDRTITEITYTPDKDSLGALIGCDLICTGATTNVGDTLFIDDEGLLKPQQYFFRWKPRSDSQPYAGNGIWVGREVETGRGYYTEDPTPTIEQLSQLIEFLSVDDAKRWAATHWNEPATTITTSRGTTVISRVSDVWSNTFKDDDDDKPISQ